MTRHRVPVLGAPVDALSWDEALARIAAWVEAGASRSVCCCNVHMAVTQQDDPELAAALQQADLVTPDGAPVAAWLQHATGLAQPRISGPDLMARCLVLAQERHWPVFLLGSTEATLARLQRRLQDGWPGLRLAGSYSPPFHPLTEPELQAIGATLRAAQPGLVLVALGCPKQEKLMARLRGEVTTVMIGVGAAFDFHAGMQHRAPRWMQTAGLEWLHRLSHEPRRLLWRYLSTNTRFAIGAMRYFIARRLSR